VGTAASRRREAEAGFQEALARARGGDPRGALRLLEQAHALDAQHGGIRNALGVLRLETGDAGGAVAVLRPLAQAHPREGAIQLNLGNALVAAGRADESLAPLAAATRCAANDPLAWYGYARALHTAGRPVEAAAAYARTLALDPAHVEARASLASAWYLAGRPEDAEAEASLVLAAHPGHAGARFNRAVVRLACRRWRDGWADYEARTKTELLDAGRRHWAQPAWTTQPLAGRTLLVHAEQGFGDTLQYARWLPRVRARRARVVLVVPAPLETLLRASGLADQVCAFGDPLPPHDLQLPLPSLPYRLGLVTDREVMGNGAPYLTVPAGTPPPVGAWVGATAPRVGVVWAGHGTHVNDRHRSVGLAAMTPLLSHPGVTWVSLQHGPRAAELAEAPPTVSVHDHGPALRTFADTAAALAALDLVITVDSAVAHLAGAMGRPCWLLLPRIGADWRWLAESESTRWYASVTVIRQATPGSWALEMAALREGLAGFVGAD
jgi:Flp pilus assembly protein TadD